MIEMLAISFSFFFIIFYPAGESSRRRLFLPCVVSLEESNVIFCHEESLVTCQRERGRNKDRIKTKRAWLKDCSVWHISLNTSRFASFEQRGKLTLKYIFVVLSYKIPYTLYLHMHLANVWASVVLYATWEKVILSSLIYKVHVIEPALWGLFIFKFLLQRILEEGEVLFLTL